MTSQVAVLNQRGVAVASDTVVTVSSTDASGERTVRTFANQTKIQQLGPAHQVVIASSGDANVNGVDVMLLISEWGRSCPEPLDSLSDYVVSLRTWLDSGQWPIDPDSETRSAVLMIRSFFAEVQGVIEDRREGSVSKKSVQRHSLLDLATEVHEGLSSADTLPYASDESDRRWMDKVGIGVGELIDDVFVSEWDHVRADVDVARPTLEKTAPLVLSRIHSGDPLVGLAIIGYGTKDLFPRVISLGFRGRYGDTARLWERETVDHTDGILAMAQSDAIEGFMYGATDNAMDSFIDMLRARLDETSGRVPELRTLHHGLVEGLIDEWFQMVNRTYRLPLLETVKLLTLAELADLAESLVGIQALRAHASPEPPSVGGLIESLVIDRYEGVRWINRLPR